AYQFTRRVVLVTRWVVGMLHQQRGVDTGVVHLRELVGWQGRGKLPGLAPHRIVAKATGELTLGPVAPTAQVIAIHVAVHLHRRSSEASTCLIPMSMRG